MYGITFVRLEYRAPMPDRLMGKDSNLDPGRLFSYALVTLNS